MKNFIYNVIKSAGESYLNEKSINAKKRDIRDAIQTYTKGKSGYNNIRTFGIITAMNPDSIQLPASENKKRMHEFANSLKSAHYVFVQQKGHYGGNNEYSYFIFNISLDTLMYYAGKYEQTSFFYCELINDEGVSKVKSSYYEKQDTNASYHKKHNPYVFIESSNDYVVADDAEDYSEINGKFRFNIPLKYFEKFNNTVDLNLRLFENNTTDIIEKTIKGTGRTPWYWRQKLYKGLL